MNEVVREWMNVWVNTCIDICGTIHSYRILTPGFSSIMLVFLSHRTQAGEAALESYQPGGWAEGQRGERMFPSLLAHDCKCTVLAEGQSAVEMKEKQERQQKRGGQGCRSLSWWQCWQEKTFCRTVSRHMGVPPFQRSPFLSFFLEGLQDK